MQEAFGFAYALDRVVWFPFRLLRHAVYLFTRGPSLDVTIPADDLNWSGKAIERLLRQNGVACWGWLFHPYDYVHRVTIRQADAAKAAAVLSQYQIPNNLQPAPDAMRNWQPQPARPQTRGAKRWLFG